jgi:hypothetical protein
MQCSVETNPPVRSWLFLLVLAVPATGLTLLGISQHVSPATASLEDFVEYWGAGRLNARGENPYDPQVLYCQEKEVSPHLTNAIMMWNPPWALSLVMPFAEMPASLGHGLWLLAQLILLLVCADWIWRYYGGARRDRWLALLVTLSFAPTFFLLHMGQISALILLGVVGFLHFEKRGQWMWAGAVAALVTIKPHVIYLFGAALVLWTMHRRRWTLVVGGALALGLLTVIPLAFNPQVLRQYREVMAADPPQMLSPTIGSLLRLGFGLDKLWLQFVPGLFGLSWLLCHWIRHRHHWVWAEQTPLLLFASFLTTSYGAWPFDLVVLLIPVLQVTVWCVRIQQSRMVAFALITLVGFDVLALLLRNIRWSDQYLHVWMTPMLLLGYLAIRRQISREPLSEPVPVSV